MVLRKILPQNINPFVKLWCINYVNLEKNLKERDFKRALK